ncbi:hypothetical protein BHU77_09390 [Enterococcus faecalis]|nr:hypothetical protein BHU77_09390 [Enterococcus faecalis]
MYNVVEKSIPFLEKYSFWMSIALFLFWVIQKKSKLYISYLTNKAKNNYERKYFEIFAYNEKNKNHQIQLTSSWLDLYKSYWKRTNNTLLLSFIFAYISFNTTSYFRNDSDNFFKLLTISTSLFLAGLTYIQQLYRE